MNINIRVIEQGNPTLLRITENNNNNLRLRFRFFCDSSLPRRIKTLFTYKSNNLRFRFYCESSLPRRIKTLFTYKSLVSKNKAAYWLVRNKKGGV